MEVVGWLLLDGTGVKILCIIMVALYGDQYKVLELKLPVYPPLWLKILGVVVLFILYVMLFEYRCP